MGVTTTPATGARGAIHVGDETNYGTLVAPTHLIEFTSETLSAEENELQSEAIRDNRGVNQLIRGNLDVQGEISFEQNASGLGILLRHALGDYVRCEKADGGAHARLMSAGSVTITAPAEATGGNRHVLVFTGDHTGGFTETNGKFAYVYRDSFNDLAYDDNTAAGFDYESYSTSAVTYITAVNNTAIDYTNTGTPSAVTSIVVAQVRDVDGNLVDPDFNPNGGVVVIGSARNEYHYFEYDKSTRKLWLSPASVTAHGDPSVNDYAMGRAGLANTATGNGAFTGANLAKGVWIYEYATGNTGVYTHHIERGRYLPTGMTIEVDRDAAIFLYSGCKVDTLNLNFEANAIVTGSISVVGRAEHAMATLQADVLPGAASIIIDKGDAFPSAGAITIGEETSIRYTSRTENPDGTVTLGGITTDTNNEHSIQRFHPKGQNVDSRSSTKAGTVYEGLTSPLSSYEILAYIDGYWEEVLSASITLNNNLNTDKFGLGSRFRLATMEGRAEIEGNLGMEFDDGKHYNKFLTGDYFSVELKCISESDDSLIGSTEVPSQAYYFLPKCKYNGTTPQISSDDIINHDMPFRAIVDTTYGDTDFVIILVNGAQNDVEAP